MHLCFALYEGQAENHLYVFPYDLNTRLTFMFHFHDLLFVFIFIFITWLLSFYCQDYIFHAHVLSSYDPSSQMLIYMIKIV
jgi:hypothetical protein